VSSFIDIDVYVVDVCGTLVRDDTTLGLLRHHFARTKELSFRYALFSAMTACRSPVRFGFAVLERFTGRHLLKHVAVRLLAGDSADALAQSAVEYAAVLLKDRRVESVWRLIEPAARSGRVLLASASLEPIVACLAFQIGARHVASQLEQQNGVLTGRYARDLKGQKDLFIRDKYGANVMAGRVCAISDNLSDRALLEKAAQSFVVLHMQAHRRRWQGLDATFLEVDE
jgi:phosphoserine phosphatase